jgi:hypothetical protein
LKIVWADSPTVVRLGVGSSILGFCLTFKPSGKPEVCFMEDYVLGLRKAYLIIFK